ncbi:hypothetical protein [Campylobacter sp. RM12651]|uniref:hypothetical protein n=1 Tax=Campylobacter sp. RM12651 TaxID=1660079 RepID=UPI001EFA2EC5|nr:hypothetical protein [Campylobacter sp. RM12651]ULO03797.1 hypothetical protein AVBRAN_1343 [Campylobacter sp. RM12651]
MNIKNDLYTLLDFKVPNKLRNYMFFTLFLMSIYGYLKGASIIVAICFFVSIWYFCYCFDPSGPQYAYKMKKQSEERQKYILKKESNDI